MQTIDHSSCVGPYEIALEAASTSEPNFELARSMLEKARREGDHRATYALATWSLFGHGGVELDLKTAVSLLKEAADADISSAHFDLAVCYEKGTGVKVNKRRAYRHYLSAAVNGDNDAYREVGRCLYYGIGTDRDRKSAEIWLRASAVETVIR